MKKNILLFILLGFSTAGFSQKVDTDEIKNKLVLTEAENKAWFDTLEKMPIIKQFPHIVERLVLDTNIYIYEGYHTYRIKGANTMANKISGCCKPLILILNGDKTTYFGYLPHLSPLRKEVITINDLNKVVKDILVEKVTVFTGAGATALYGKRGVGGVIVLTITDEKSLKILERVAYD